MTDFLRSLLERGTGSGGGIRPRIPGIFEPVGRRGGLPERYSVPSVPRELPVSARQSGLRPPGIQTSQPIQENEEKVPETRSTLSKKAEDKPATEGPRIAPKPDTTSTEKFPDRIRVQRGLPTDDQVGITSRGKAVESIRSQDTSAVVRHSVKQGETPSQQDVDAVRIHPTLELSQPKRMGFSSSNPTADRDVNPNLDPLPGKTPLPQEQGSREKIEIPERIAAHFRGARPREMQNLTPIRQSMGSEVFSQSQSERVVEPPHVQVTIGRVEVRPARADLLKRPLPTIVEHKPSLTLDEYLKRRDSGKL